MGQILTGIIETVVYWTAEGNLVGLPMANITDAKFMYSGNIEKVMAQTFNGVAAPIGAALMSEEASFELNANFLEWAIFQAASGYLSEAYTGPIDVVEPVTFSQVDGTPNSTHVLRTPTVNDTDPVLVVDYDGNVYSATPVTSGDTTITLASDITGTQAYIYYKSAAPVGADVLNLGAGASLPEFGLSGRFKGPQGTIQVLASRVFASRSLELAGGGQTSKVGSKFECLIGNDGNFAQLIRLPVDF